RDSEWKRIRTVISPAFTSGKLKRMTPLILECVDTMNDNIDKIIAKSNSNLSAPVDMKLITGAYSAESTIQVAFGRKVSGLYDRTNPIIENVHQMISPSFVTRMKAGIIMMAPNVAQMLKLTFISSKVTAFFRDFTFNLIDDRKRVLETGSPVKRVDFLQLMLNAMSDDNNEAINGSEEYTDSKCETYMEIQVTDDVVDKSLSYDELIAQSVMFLIGAYENTSTTLSLCLYSIAKHPEVQHKLYDEIHTFHGQKKSSADPYETIHSLKYMDAVIDETLRLFPPLLFLNRVATEDYELKGTGITIKKDHVVHIPTYAMHRDPEYFADPQVFRPERFLPENIAHNPYTYLPWGAGPRNCLGTRLAQLEIKLALVNLVHRYVFHTTDKPLEQSVSGDLIITKSVDLKIEKRL
ncbi:unnamed protein product, partial [Oppiella nova]